MKIRLGTMLVMLLISVLGTSGVVYAGGMSSPIGLKMANKEREYAKNVSVPTFALGDVQIKQDRSRLIPIDFDNPAEKRCRPFCIQPENIDGATTINIGDFPRLADAINGDQILLLDLRSWDWFQAGTLPGATHFPYHNLYGANANSAMKKLTAGKDIIVFCNGWWCHQSPVGVLALERIGYTGKIYYFRGGVQDWVDAGLPLIKPKQ